MKILISAYSCEPGQGSERGVGWNVAREVAKRHEVWVLTRPDESKDAIEAELARHPVPNLHFVYFTLPFWQDSLRWGQSGAMQIHYYLWQIQAYFVAKELHQKIGFDLAHHVTFVKYSSPSFLAFLPIPFIWGPVGGGETAPASFWQDFSPKARLYEISRELVRKVGEYDPFTRLTARKSTVVRATTADTAKRLLKMGAVQPDIIQAIGFLSEELEALQNCSLPLDQPLRFISMGRLLHWKGYHLGLRAFARANLPNAEYWLVGEGPELANLQQLAKALGIAEKVQFWGRLSREDTLAKLANCHILVHPSLHDSGGWVCIEGMAAGRPIICLDLGGPAVQVTEETGFKVTATDPNQTIVTMAEAMVCLAQDSSLRNTMGAAGKKMVSENYSWKILGERLDTLYQKTVQNLPVEV